MKKFLYICIGVVVCLASLYACVKDPTTDANQSNNPNTFLTVEEAQSFFEDSFADATRTGGGNTYNSGYFCTGDFIPQWSQACASEDESGGRVGVPMSATYRYRSVRSEFKNGRAKAYIVNISQQLLIVKGKRNEVKSQYILTLIPDKDFYTKSRGDIARKFLHSDNRGKFSGTVVYSLSSGTITRMDVYREGQKMWGVSPYKGSDESDRLRLFGVIIDRLRDMHIQRGALTTLTRVWVEMENEFGEWEWFYYECSVCAAAGRSECTCEVEINYCGELYCYELCQTCPYNCETPWCYGECKDGTGLNFEYLNEVYDELIDDFNNTMTDYSGYIMDNWVYLGLEAIF